MESLDEILQRYGKQRKLSPGEVLFHQGSVSDGVYYLKWGQLGAYREEEGNFFLLSNIAPGEMVGELGATTGKSRSATVRAGKESCVIHIAEADFRRALTEAPTLAAEIIRMVGDRLTDADTVRITLGRSYRQAVGRAQALRSEKAQLEELLRLREELANMIVHDLRNPLSVITTGLDLLEHAPPANTEATYADMVTEMMGRSVRRMQRLVNTLLDIACLEEGHMTLHLLPLDVSSLVEEVIEEERPLAQGKRVTLENRATGELSRVLADPDVIPRVVANLLDNAIKFTPRGGRVWVETRDEGEEIRIEVVDTGAGIPPEERERVFEKFTQVPGQEEPRRGSGLGLAFCQMAVEAHGGRIRVEDGPGDNGTRIVFTLPKAHNGSES
jgi:signal transduction histidine kinase